jgi:hypothetical protein
MSNKDRIIGWEFRGSQRQNALIKQFMDMVANNREESERAPYIKDLTASELEQRVRAMVANHHWQESL